MGSYVVSLITLSLCIHVCVHVLVPCRYERLTALVESGGSLNKVYSMYQHPYTIPNSSTVCL
jgi:hypothetical protein